MLKAVAGVLGERVAADQPLMEAGLDSIGAVELRNAVSAKFGVELAATTSLDHPTAAALAAHIAAVLGPQRVAHGMVHARITTLGGGRGRVSGRTGTTDIVGMSSALASAPTASEGAPCRQAHPATLPRCGSSARCAACSHRGSKHSCTMLRMLLVMLRCV